MLTIEAGTVVKDQGATVGIFVGGVPDVQGTAEQPSIFFGVD